MMNAILFEPSEIDKQSCVRFTDARARHLVDVLKVRPGSVVRIGMLDGPLGEGRVTRVDGGTVDLACALQGEPPPVPPVDLLLALPRPKVMKRLWAQLAALGVGRIILTNAEKVERNYFDTHVLDESFYRPLLVEGLQQARDTRLPRVTIHKQFRKLVEDELATLSDAQTRLVAHPGNADGAPRAALQSRVLLAIGAEGGWNEFELQLLESRGFHRFSMGPRTLRTDTACIALLALLHREQDG
jgi:16S rRNA (uracil1498-N3)-methyltransferase